MTTTVPPAPAAPQVTKAEAWPATPDEFIRRVREFQTAHGQPAVDPTVPLSAAYQRDPVGTMEAADREGAALALAQQALALTDVGNSARLVRDHGHLVRYCHATSVWHVFDGVAWRPDNRGVVLDLAKRSMTAILAEAAREQDDGRRAALAKHGTASCRRERIHAAIELAKPNLSIGVDEMDSDPLLLNCQNGTVDLRTGRLRRHESGDFLTKVAGGSYDPNAPCPVWTAFLERVFRTTPDLIHYGQLVAGYCSTGSVREQVWFFLYGTGANGKTTWTDAITGALGDYAAKADSELLLAKDGGSGHPCGIADLQGRRLAVCSEVGDGRRFNEVLTKDLTGESKLKARRMYGNFFEFTATHKLLIFGNHKPAVRGQDHGFWRRLRLLPFVEVIGDNEKDRDLPEKLRGEIDGILSWIVVGAVKWFANGLPTPPEVASATGTYRGEQDTVGQFLDDATITGTNLQAYAADLYAAYTTWCDKAGEYALSQKRLGTALRERGLLSDRCSYSDRTRWIGIGLRAEGG